MLFHALRIPSASKGASSNRSGCRWFAALGALAVLVLLGGFGSHGAAPGVTCPTRCDGGGMVLHGSRQTAPTSCVHDVGCGGGGVLTSNVAPIVAVFSAVGIALAA